MIIKPNKGNTADRCAFWRLIMVLGEKKGIEMMSTKANIATEKFLGGYN